MDSMMKISPKRAPFIVFEGIDGSGKSTLADITASALVEDGHSVRRFSEPTGGVSGRKIRELLSSPIKPDPDILLRLFIDDRRDDVEVNIRPAIYSGDVVIMDRYFHSNAAYQGASGLSHKRILKANIDRGFPVPDRVYLLDCDPETALKRIASRNAVSGQGTDLFEKADFLAEVRAIYLDLADNTFIILDASKTLTDNLEIVMRDISESFFNV